MILVRKVPMLDVFYKVGLVTHEISQFRLWSNSLEMVETRKMVVLWDYDRRLHHANDLFDRSIIPYVFILETQKSTPGWAVLSKTKSLTEGADLWDSSLTWGPFAGPPAELWDSWIPLQLAADHSQVVIDFDHPTAIAIARLTWIHTAGLGLVVFLAFDFDPYPWALVCKVTEEPFLSALVDKLRNIHRRKLVDDERGMMEILHKYKKGSLYAFRGPLEGQSSVSMKVPATLSVSDDNILLSFIAPRSYRNDSPYWVFRMSQAAPRRFQQETMEPGEVHELSGNERDR